MFKSQVLVRLLTVVDHPFAVHVIFLIERSERLIVERAEFDHQVDSCVTAYSICRMHLRTR
jgi:hypothetical protein